MIRRLHSEILNRISTWCMNPRGRSLYVYTGESLIFALRNMFTQFMAGLFPPQWIYRVWSSPKDERADAGWIGGETHGYFLHMQDAKREVQKLKNLGFISGWAQESLSRRPYRW